MNKIIRSSIRVPCGGESGVLTRMDIIILENLKEV